MGFFLFVLTAVAYFFAGVGFTIISYRWWPVGLKKSDSRIALGIALCAIIYTALYALLLNYLI